VSAEHQPLASVVVLNYNYGRFLAEAIDSALDQTHVPTEVIVVDDGSTDDSRTVISRYGAEIKPVLRENGGQGAAINTGFAASSGEVLIFLDADDVLLPTAVEVALQALRDPGTAKVHWPMVVIDAEGHATGSLKEPVLPAGDFRDIVRERGPMTEATLPSAPTSGNAWPRWLLELILPMPQADYWVNADAYLFGLAPAFGRVARAEPQGRWRYHGSNTHKRMSFERKVELGVANFQRQCEVLGLHWHLHEGSLDQTAWRSNAWWTRIADSIDEIGAITAEGDLVILADGDTWGTDDAVRHWHRIPFLEGEGIFWGEPSDDAEAMRALDEMRGRGAALFVFAWPTFWWLDHYAEFARHMRTSFRCVLDNDRLLAFDLRRSR
jgi:glycosyltransferase involved in cell wall biosynthesis